MQLILHPDRSQRNQRGRVAPDHQPASRHGKRFAFKRAPFVDTPRQNIQDHSHSDSKITSVRRLQEQSLRRFPSD